MAATFVFQLLPYATLDRPYCNQQWSLIHKWIWRSRMFFLDKKVNWKWNGPTFSWTIEIDKLIVLIIWLGHSQTELPYPSFSLIRIDISNIYKVRSIRCDKFNCRGKPPFRSVLSDCRISCKSFLPLPPFIGLNLFFFEWMSLKRV